MTLSSYKASLKDKFCLGFQNGTQIIKSQGLKEDSPILTDFLTLESQYSSNERNFVLGLIAHSEYNTTRQRTITGVLETIDRLNISDLDEDSLSYFNNVKGQVFDSYTQENSTEDDIDWNSFVSAKDNNILSNLRIDRKFILEKIINEFVHVPKNSYNLAENDKLKHEYIKRIMQCQEYFSIGEYNKAFLECEYIKSNLEPKSAQLYELFFISYFKITGGEDSIIQDIENDKFEKFTNLELFSKRCSAFNKDFLSTQTAKENIELVCVKLTNALSDRYKVIKYDYIVTGDNFDLRKKIEKYINCSIDITTEISISSNSYTLFLETALIELNGGGKLDWIEIDNDWKLVDKTNFPAIKKRFQIEAILKKAGKIETTKKMLYRILGEKYTRIKLNTERTNLSAVTESTIKFIKSSILAYKFYDDSRFLEPVFEELKGNGRVSWYDLDATNKIVENEICIRLNYKPKNDLNRIISKLGKENKKNEIFKEIHDYLFRQLVLKNLQKKIWAIGQKYQEVLNDTRADELTNRLKIIDCMDTWEQLYNESKDQENTIHKCIEELKGKGKFNWFIAKFTDSKEYTLENNSICIQLNFDAYLRLNKYLFQSSIYIEESSRMEVFNEIRINIANIIAKEADKLYESL